MIVGLIFICFLGITCQQHPRYEKSRGPYLGCEFSKNRYKDDLKEILQYQSMLRMSGIILAI